MGLAAKGGGAEGGGGGGKGMQRPSARCQVGEEDERRKEEGEGRKGKKGKMN